MGEYSVEGEWKNFIFKMMVPETHPLILKVLRNAFCRDEPLCKFIGYSEDHANDVEKMALYDLNKNDNLSFYAEDKKSGKIAGFNITCIKHKDDHDHDLQVTSKEAVRVVGVLTQSADGADVFEHFGVDKYGYFAMTSVDPEFRGQGLVTEMYKRTLELLRAKGIPACAALFTSPFTRKVAENLKFEEIFTKRFVDCKDEEGNSLVPNAGQDDCCSVMAVRL